MYKKHKGYDIFSLNKSALMHTPAIWGTYIMASRLQRAPGCYIVTIYLQTTIHVQCVYVCVIYLYT